MGYYDIPERIAKERGIDYDLGACLEYNPQPFHLLDIAKVVGVIEGDRDGPAWHWLIRLHDGRIAYLSGGCDYTGWDCQSFATSTLHATLDEALAATPIEDDYSEPKRLIRAVLAEQLASGKHETAAEKLDAEFGR